MRILASILVFFLSVAAYAQKWSLEWDAYARTALGTGEYLPFWARTGEDGTLPVASAETMSVGTQIRYDASCGLYFQAGAKVVGAAGAKSLLNENPVYGMVDRLYVSGGWRRIHLDLGMKPQERELSDLTVSGGNVLYSRNSRNMPGINLHTDWLSWDRIPWIGIKGNLAHYRMTGDRCVMNTLLHNKGVAGFLKLGKRVEIMAGFDHYAQWGGYSDVYGQQLQSFKDYLNVFFGKKGGDDALWTDQNNVFGNHLGREWARISWKADDFTMTFQYDKMFEDNSGMVFRNFPDGVWTLEFAFRRRDAFVTDIAYEFINTTWQTGPLHDRPATEDELAKQDPDDPFYGKIVLGGCDNYFNNSPYNSGWTHYGRVIGLPLIIPAAPGADGITRGVINNRVRGHHLGIKGVCASVPYKFMSTFTQNFGLYHQSKDSFFSNTPWQLSLALEADITSCLKNLPIGLNLGIYGDVGEMYRNSFGFTLKISYSDSRRF